MLLDATAVETHVQLHVQSQFSHKSVNLVFLLVVVKDKLTDLCRS